MTIAQVVAARIPILEFRDLCLILDERIGISKNRIDLDIAGLVGLAALLDGSRMRLVMSRIWRAFPKKRMCLRTSAS